VPEPYETKDAVQMNYDEAVTIFTQIFGRKPDMKFPQDIALLVEFMHEAWTYNPQGES
jgi:hypothetical protein